MSFNRARYVTVCQQVLVTAVTLAVGLSAAGVMTLTIVDPGGGEQAQPFRSAVHVTQDEYVDTKPVTPKVTEVAATTVAADPAAAGVEESDADSQDEPADEPTDEATDEPTGEATDEGGRTAAPDEAHEHAAEGLELAVLTTPQRVHGYATVGVTWAPGVELDEDELAIAIRTQKGTTWSEWQAVEYHVEHQPEAAEARQAGEARPGTDALVVGDVDRVQMRAMTPTGKAPADMKLAVIDPGEGTQEVGKPAIDAAKIPEAERDARDAPLSSTTPEGDAPAEEELADSDLELQAMPNAPRPQIYSRAQWGANEKIRESGPPDYGTIKTGFVHHTVNANNYSKSQVPALIRGIYAYHVQSRGWRDIGYNFLVDRFGRIWEGRYGGVARPVIGAHTSGFNDVGFAMSAIGNFETTKPSSAVINAYAKLMAWKLSLHNIKAAQTGVTIKGKRMGRINGHRDVGATACPGRYLYAKRSDIRVKARQIQRQAENGGSTPPPPTDDGGVRPPPAGSVAPMTAPTKAVVQPKVSPPVRTSVAGNGWPDVVTKDKAGTIRVHPTQGLVGFRDRVLRKGPWGRMAHMTPVGDVTGDGHGDVLAREAGTMIARIYPGNGKGGVSTAGRQRTKRFQYANLILGVGDWNRDGRNDVITRDRRNNGLYLHLGKGKGVFAAPRLIRRNWTYARTAAAGDLNGDGRVDLVVWRSATNKVVRILGRGGLLPRNSMGSGTPIRTVGKVTGLAGGADLTGDGKMDILVRRSGGATRILAGNGKGGIAHVHGDLMNLAGISQLGVSRMKSARRGDVIGRDNRTRRLAVLENNGRRNLGATIKTNLKVPGATAAFSVGDWNRDGNGDIVVRDKGGDRLVLYRGRGNGQFVRGISLGTGWKGVTELAGVGDVTGDGIPDLMGRVGSDTPKRIWPGKKDGGLKRAAWSATRVRTYNQIGGDRWYTRAPSPQFLSAGTKVFVPAAGSYENADRSLPSRRTNGYDQFVGVGDVNGDGQADLLARAKSTGNLWLLPGKASGAFGPRVWVGSGFAGYQSIG